MDDLEEFMERIKSSSYGVMLTIEVMFKTFGRCVIRELTLTFPEETLMTIIFLSSSLDLFISSEMGRETRMRGRSDEAIAAVNDGASG